MSSRIRCLALGLLTTATAQTFAPLGRPPEVAGPAAFDTLRRRLVLFGNDGVTWELSNGELLPRISVGSGPTPTPRVLQAMCYDEARRRVMMFGGSGSVAAMDETWAYDGSRWVQLNGGPVPPARFNGLMTWDAVRGRAVLFGGSGVAPLSDTWEHDGTSWLQRTPATSPGSNLGKMTFDRQRGVAVLVLFPAVPGPGSTWEWNGIDWSLRATTGPVVDGGVSLAFDALRNRSVLVGTVDRRVWQWDGTAWAQSPPMPQSFRRTNAASWFDPGSGCVTFAGGFDPFPVTGNPRRSDLWQWDGQVLTLVQSDMPGPSSVEGMMISDLTRGRVIFLGGVSATSQPLNETWSWNGNAWSAVASSTAPSPRWCAATAHDLLRGESLLFGGCSTTARLGDTWSFGGNGWTARSTSGPAARVGAAMAADLVRGVIVLFGGDVAPLGSTSLADDTWEWNGALWTQRATSSQPSRRIDAAMAFHPQMGRVLLFGGRTAQFGGPLLRDTWTWDGSQWTELTPATVPPGLAFSSMHTVLATNRCLLVGIGALRQEVWEHDGNDWRQLLSEALSVQDFWRTCAAGPGFDTVTCAKPGPAVAALTFEPGRVAAIGAGCGTPPASLMVRSRPISGATTGLELVANPARAVLFAIDLASGNTPLGGGCTNWMSPAFVGLFEVSDASGFASRLLSVPPDLVGFDLFAQAIVLEPQSANGLVLTEGLRLTIGR